MLSDILKYRLNGKTGIELEGWMKFGLFLAEYIKSTSSNIKVYISVPSNLVFSYFTVLGAVDYDFRNPSKELLYNQYLGLKKGQRILYKVNGQWRAYSVLEVGSSPIDKDIRTIIVRDKQATTTYIPEKKWLDSVRIQDDGVTTIRNTRVVNNVESLTENKKLNQHDSKEKIEELQFKIEQQFLMNKLKSSNGDILKKLIEQDIILPKGVELFAWESKSES
uniref:Uncharacterized protein n=1 Tax=Batrachochytrium dendrobatidis (strain JAM81 / FGSC 10211) TaxID=684364 RepID=F4PEX9_BATDJ|eukprot:XP_006683156.1 hypothetical protein BATDEDRAFT_28722 [Batrachochytrium dendrobatidis JAM81]